MSISRILPRLYLIKPAFCSELAMSDTLGRRTPSIWARNSCVSTRVVASGEVPHPQQPAAHARFHRVAGVAGSGLLRLREQDLFVTIEKRAERLELPGDLAKRLDRDGGGQRRQAAQ